MYKVLALVGALISAEASALNVPATDHNIVYEGRVVKLYETGQVNVNWPGSRFKTKLVGKSIQATLVGLGNQFDVLVDGQLHKKNHD